MTIRELKQILNSTTEWDDKDAYAAVVIGGIGGTTAPITEVVIDWGVVYIGNDPEGCDYATTTKKDYYGED